jgi:hypothetical protein
LLRVFPARWQAAWFIRQPAGVKSSCRRRIRAPAVSSTPALADWVVERMQQHRMAGRPIAASSATVDAPGVRR